MPTEGHQMGDEANGTTYGLYPHHEQRLGKTPFYHMPKTSFIDYFNLMFYCGAAFLFFYYFVGNYDSMGYIAFIFGIILFCETMT
tara:strand:- start:638 stop:892 length:255 start_codon:yes stop_codon:yes gene_type:complete